ncbi:MAG TPA: hypothetical protein VGR47_07470 [Terracidiphilus sp.]|nr:hypothetical protein [Terracidiphilus sp.]
MGQVIRRCGIDRAARRSQCALYCIWLQVEALPVFLVAQDREDRPTVASIWRLLYGALKRRACGEVFLCIDALKVGEAA